MPFHKSSRDAGTNFKKLEMMARADRSSPNPGTTGKLKSGGWKRNNSVSVNIGKLCLAGSKESAWVERYFPKSMEDHFVHKTKVKQFESWLDNAKGSKMCLLTGPAGAGKTATVYLVAKQLGYHVKEWVNPMTLTQYRAEGYTKDYTSDEVQWRSAVDSFVEFLLRSSQYATLPIKGKSGAARRKSLILVEDFPSFFYTDLSLLHGFLRNYKTAGESPLVFIMTDTTSSDLSSYKLFPKSLLLELDIHEIALNPVAPSFMTKFLNCVLSQAGVEIKDPMLLADVLASSGGDIRSAVNSLQFRLQTTKIRKGHLSKKRKLTITEDTKSLAVAKDESLFVFHAIGKVLYCKRNVSDVVEMETEKLEGKLAVHRRIHPLKEVPEEIGDRIGVSPETFFNFLAQNYLSFFTSLADVTIAASCLADASTIFSHWVADETGSQNNANKSAVREDFGLSVAIRGLMFANQNPAGSSWKPLNKPKFREVTATSDTMIQNTRAFCPGPVTQDYFTDLVPYMSLLSTQQMPHEKRRFLDEFGRFGKYRRGQSYILDAANGGGIDDVVTEISQPVSDLEETQIERTAPDETEEYEITEVSD